MVNHGPRTAFGPLQMSHRARRVLDAIRAHPTAFEVTSWVRPPDDAGLEFLLRPGQNPAECGTTLCVAGWAAWLGGWAIAPSGRAYKEGAASWVALAGAEFLGIAHCAYWTLFNQASNDDAIMILEFMAANNRFPDAPDIFKMWEESHVPSSRDGG